jgi:hypothetical protein
MTTTPLIIGGAFTCDGDDFSDAVTHVMLAVDANEVAVPATLANPTSARKGSNKYTLNIGFLSNDLAAELFTKLYDAIDTSDGQLAFTLKLRNEAVSASNPEWSGTFVAIHAALGGDAETLSVDSATFTLLGRPTKATS